MINVDENSVWEEYVKVNYIYIYAFFFLKLSFMSSYFLLIFSYVTFINCSQSHNDAISFRYKRIPNWDDIVDLCGKNRATGEGVETSAEAIEAMTPPVNEVNHVDLEGDDQGLEDIHIIEDTSPNPPSSQKKRNQATLSYSVPPQKKKVSTKDVLATSVDRMASSFEDLIRATTQSLAPKEV